MKNTVSRLHTQIVQAIGSESTTVNNWSDCEQRLELLLRALVELPEQLNEIEGIITTLSSEEWNNRPVVFNDLASEFHFCSLDLSQLWSLQLECSTWNLLDFLSPTYYFQESIFPLRERFAHLFVNKRPEPQGSLDGLSGRLISKGIDQKSAEAVQILLAEFLTLSQQYKRLIDTSHQSENYAEVFYALYGLMSTATRLLAVTIGARVILESVSYQLKLVD